MDQGNFDLHKGEIEKFCQQWKIRELSVFGSVLRSDFRPDSDIDVIVDFEPNSGHTLFDMVSMNDELKGIFGREVDLLTRPAIEQSRNYIF
jgi:uncharacterized protein